MLDDYVTHAVDKVKMLAYVFIDLYDYCQDSLKLGLVV